MGFGDRTERKDIHVTVGMTMYHHPNQFADSKAELEALLEELADSGENIEILDFKEGPFDQVEIKVEDGPLAQVSDTDRGVLGILAEHCGVSIERVSEALAKGSFRFKIG